MLKKRPDWLTEGEPASIPGRILRRGALIVFVVTSLAACHPRSVAQRASRPDAASPQGRAVRHLCADVGTDPCIAACPPSLPAHEHAECLIDYRFSSDAAARELALSLFARTGALPGIDAAATRGSYGGRRVVTRPALPLGEDRRHLEWILASFDRYEVVLRALREHAARPVAFRLEPDAFLFFRTGDKTYPSAWGGDGVVGYNLDGPLHGSERDVLETLFHELFHLNDEHRGRWSAAVLGDLFAVILDRCGEDHECLGPFAPYDTVVPGGTYYPFDARTRDVREYGGELALRYFLEHEAILDGAPREPPFKCLTEENQRAWVLLASDFFGDADMTRDCAPEDASTGS